MRGYPPTSRVGAFGDDGDAHESEFHGDESATSLRTWHELLVRRIAVVGLSQRRSVQRRWFPQPSRSSRAVWVARSARHARWPEGHQPRDVGQGAAARAYPLVSALHVWPASTPTEGSFRHRGASGRECVRRQGHVERGDDPFRPAGGSADPPAACGSQPAHRAGASHSGNELFRQSHAPARPAGEAGGQLDAGAGRGSRGEPRDRSQPWHVGGDLAHRGDDRPRLCGGDVLQRRHRPGHARPARAAKILPGCRLGERVRNDRSVGVGVTAGGRLSGDRAGHRSSAHRGDRSFASGQGGARRGSFRRTDRAGHSAPGRLRRIGPQPRAHRDRQTLEHSGHAAIETARNGNRPQPKVPALVQRPVQGIQRSAGATSLRPGLSCGAVRSASGALHQRAVRYLDQSRRAVGSAASSGSRLPTARRGRFHREGIASGRRADARSARILSPPRRPLPPSRGLENLPRFRGPASWLTVRQEGGGPS